MAQLKSHKVERLGSRVTVSGRWMNNFKRPVAVTIEVKPADGGDVVEQIIQGEVKDVDGVLAGIAEIAWSRGWRPEGFIGHICQVITNFKVVK